MLDQHECTVLVDKSDRERLRKLKKLQGKAQKYVLSDIIDFYCKEKKLQL